MTKTPLVVAVLLSSACIFPAGGRFLEGTEVLEKGQKRMSVSVLGGGPLVAGDVGTRVRIGLGQQQEVRVEASIQVPRPSGLVRVSWKRQINEYVATVVGARTSAGFVYNSDDYGYSLNVGVDGGIVFSTGVARPLPKQWFRPYLGVRLGSDFRLWGGSHQSPIVAILPSGSIGVRYAVNDRVFGSIEIGYVPIIGYVAPPDPNNRHDYLIRITHIREESYLWYSGHLIYGGVGIEWGRPRASTTQNRVDVHFDRTIKDADAAMDHGDYDAAVGLFERAFGLRDQAWILCNIGEAYRRKLEWSAARKAFQRCLERDPQAHYAEAVKHILEELPEAQNAP
jgi:hypothetical protein